MSPLDFGNETLMVEKGKRKHDYVEQDIESLSASQAQIDVELERVNV
jgi:hypothetical protein